ncbi:MAG TPA: pseudouridine synthase [bacterium]|nr:pseudouridine synthase [bacterium]
MNDTAKLLMLNKPKGYVVTRSDEKDRKTVYTLLPDWAYEKNWKPVGRLDLDSKGLLLFTRNDKLADRITQPGSCLKTYEVWVRGLITDVHIKQALKGVENSGELLKVFQVEIKGGAGHKTKLEVVLDEGKNRHIRRLFGSLKDKKFGTPLKVLELKRVRIGGLNLDVESGKWRFLNQDEELLLS